MYTPRGRVRAARPRADTSRLASAASSPASAAAPGPGAAAASASRASCSCSTSRSTRGGSGCGVDPVDRRHPLALEQLGDLLVGEDHQPLDQPVGLGLLRRRGRRRRCRAASKRNSGSKDSTSRLVVAAPLAERRGRLARDRQRLGDQLRRARRARRRRGRAGRSRAARRSGCGCGRSSRARGVPRRAELDLGGHRQPLDARRQAAGLLAQRVRQHRLDRARDVGAVGAPPRLAVERRAGRDVGGDVGDVDPEPRAARPRAAPRPRRRSRARSPGRR